MIYLDNAATSYPKPKAVTANLTRLLTRPLGNPGRGSHPPGKTSSEIVFHARENVARLLGMEAPERVAFFGGATAALNTAVRGTVAALGRGEGPLSVYTTVFEHNAVLRPLYALEDEGKIRLSVLTPEALLPALRRGKPDLLAITLCGNVSGHVFPLEEIAPVCRRQGTVILADAAQAAGLLPLEDVFRRVDILCAPGHKGLFGMMGAGFLAVRPDAPLIPEAVFTGGSGAQPQSRGMPDLLPERLEAGTLPVIPIAALSYGVDFVLARGVEAIRARERENRKRLIEGLSVIPGVTVYEPGEKDGPVLYNRRGSDPESEARGLESAGICVRAGFHCAPLAHAYLATGDRGAVRLSPGYFTTAQQIEETLKVISRQRTADS